MSETVDEFGVVTESGNEALVLQPEHVSALAVVRGEIEMQLDAAHKYPRSVKRFLAEATTLATMDEDTAASCMYSFERGGKRITGPSIRCAEICASAWGNAHIGARIVDIDDKDVVAQGAMWDLEKNLRITVETRRRITNKRGERFNDDMITVTGNAAASIALRNAIFRIVPRAYVNRVYLAARKVAVGDATTLTEKRATVMEKLAKLGATAERVLAALGKRGVDDLGLEEIETLIGYGTAVKSGERRVDDVFPEVKPPTTAAEGPPPAEEQGRRMSLAGPKKKQMSIELPQESAAASPPRDPTSDDVSK